MADEVGTISRLDYVVAAVGLLKMVPSMNFKTGNRVISELEIFVAGGLGAPSGHILIDSRNSTSAPWVTLGMRSRFQNKKLKNLDCATD